MRLRVERALAIAVVLATTFRVAVAPGAQPRYFRIVSTAASRVVAFDSMAGLAWSNAVTPVQCQVEWTPALGGVWLTNHIDESIVCTSVVATYSLPCVLLAGTPSTILYQADAVVASPGDRRQVDLNRDGITDVQLRIESLGTLDVPQSTVVSSLLIETPHADIMTEPVGAGAAIGPAAPVGGHWSPAGRSGTTLVVSFMEWDWQNGGGVAHSTGPWYGVHEGYLPVRMAIGGRYHYGWIRIELVYWRFNNVTDFWMDYRVLDCGLQAVPDAAIIAGDR